MGGAEWVVLIGGLLTAFGAFMVKVWPQLVAGLKARHAARMEERDQEERIRRDGLQPTLNAMQALIDQNVRRIGDMKVDMDDLKLALEKCRQSHEDCMRQNFQLQVDVELLKHRLESQPVKRGGRRKTDPTVIVPQNPPAAHPATPTSNP